MLVAAASVGGFKAKVLQQYMEKVAVDLLKVERIAAKSGMAPGEARLPEGINTLRRTKLLTKGLSKAAMQL